MNKENNTVRGAFSGRVRIIERNILTGETRNAVNNNLIVDGLYPNLAQLLAGTITTNAIGAIKLGTNATAAAVTDTTIATVKTISSLTITHPTIYQVMAVGVWLGTDPVNYTDDVTEVGLFDEGSTLLARFVFGAMRKSAGWEWTIEWTLAYNIS